MKTRFRFVRFVVLVLVVFFNCARSHAAGELEFAPAPADNPLKGFLPYAGVYRDFPHSMEWFYIPLNDIQTGPNDFRWDKLEEKLKAIADRGHQAVFRVYLDYPDLSYGVPGFLAHVPKHEYSVFGNGKHFSSYSPDYENADLRRALNSFIAALGKRYDGDPRIGFLTIGLLGAWGEWHHSPDEWMASTDVQNEVLTAWEKAFRTTRILMREPKPGTNAANRRLGFHDDSFAYSTLPGPAWHFWGRVLAQAAADKWKTEPIGGELRPEVQECIWNDVSCAPEGQDFDRCVEVTHCSWLLNHGAFKLTGIPRGRAIAAVRKMGYELYVPGAVMSPATEKGSLQATIKIRNSGVAPFYYNWEVCLGALNESGKLEKEWKTNWQLTAIQPKAADTVWKWNDRNHGLKPGRYRLLLRVANPLKGGHPLKFANAAQDRDLPGWLSLESFAVAPAQLPTRRNNPDTAGARRPRN